MKKKIMAAILNFHFDFSKFEFGSMWAHCSTNIPVILSGRCHNMWFVYIFMYIAFDSNVQHSLFSDRSQP